MPNYKLPSFIKEAIYKHAQKLSARLVEHAQGDFPLTTAQVQFALMPQEPYSMLVKLRDAGIDSLPSTRSSHILLDHTKLPGLLRSAIIHITFPENVFVPKQRYWYDNVPGRWPNDPARQALIPDWSGLDSEDIAKLVKWANELVRTHRHRELADFTVAANLRTDGTGGLTSTGQVLANWPMLATLVEDKDWLTRFRCPPQNLKRYKLELLPESEKLMQATDILLTKAQLLSEYQHPPFTIATMIQVWQPQPGDRTFR